MQYVPYYSKTKINNKLSINKYMTVRVFQRCKSKIHTSLSNKLIKLLKLNGSKIYV